jgi:hypothetical protein
MKWITVPVHNKLCQYLKFDDTLVLFFRGTSGRREWLWNFLPVMQRELSGHWVDVLDDEQAKDVLDNLPGDLFHGVKYLYIGGLSRGFAVAACVTIRLQAIGVTVYGLTGFGGKRTLAWWSKGIEVVKYDDKMYAVNYANKGDIVPLLPPWYRSSAPVLYDGEWMRPDKAHWEALKMAVNWRRVWTL